MSRYAKSFRGSEIRLPGPAALIREGLEITSGAAADWYTRAARSAEVFAFDVGAPTSQVCDVLGVTSPRVSVRRNVALTRRYFEGTLDRAGLLPATAAALAHWEDRGRVTDAIRGDKTRSFSRAIQGDASAVVVDVWTVRGLGWTDRRIGRRVYKRAAAVLRGLATREGLTPAAAQAALWYGVRGRHGYLGGVTELDLTSDRAGGPVRP